MPHSERAHEHCEPFKFQRKCWRSSYNMMNMATEQPAYIGHTREDSNIASKFIYSKPVNKGCIAEDSNVDKQEAKMSMISCT